MSDQHSSSQPSSSTRGRRATPPEQPTQLGAALAAGASDDDVQRLLDRRDDVFGELDAVAEEVERADADSDAALLALLARPRFADTCWCPVVFAAARCGRSGILQRLRDTDPAAWRRAVRSAGPDGRRVLHHAAIGGQVEVLLRLLRQLRQQRARQAVNDGEEEEAVVDDADGGGAEAEAESVDEAELGGIVYALDSRGRSFLDELADLHPSLLPDLWSADLPGGLPRVLELLDPPLLGLAGLPDREEALESVALAQASVKRIIRSLSDLPELERADAVRQLVRLAQASPRLLPALLRLGIVGHAECGEAFVLELVQAGWLPAASLLMRLQQSRLVETCVAVAVACAEGRRVRPPPVTPGDCVAAAVRWLQSGEQGEDASVDCGAGGRERLRREAVTVALNALDAIYAEASGHWKARIHRHFFLAPSAAAAVAVTSPQKSPTPPALKFAEAAPELLVSPALAEFADWSWTDGPDTASGLSLALGPARLRFAPRAKHFARLCGLLILLMLLAAQESSAAAASSAAVLAPVWSGLDTAVTIWLPLQLAQDLLDGWPCRRCWDGAPAPLPIAAVGFTGAGLAVWAAACGFAAAPAAASGDFSGVRGLTLAARLLLCLALALWAARLLCALRPWRATGLLVQQLLIAVSRDCAPFAAALLPAVCLAAVPLGRLARDWEGGRRTRSPVPVAAAASDNATAAGGAAAIVVESSGGVSDWQLAVYLLLCLLPACLLLARCCRTLAVTNSLAVAGQSRARLSAAAALQSANLLPAPLNLVYAVPAALRLARRFRDRLAGRAGSDVEAVLGQHADLYGNCCHGGNADGGGGGAIAAAAAAAAQGGSAQAPLLLLQTPAGAHKEDRQFQLFQAAAFRGRRHTFARPWPDSGGSTQ